MSIETTSFAKLVAAESDCPEHVELHGDGSAVDDFSGEVPSDAHIAMVVSRAYPGPSHHVAEQAIQVSRGTERYYQGLEEEGAKWLRSEKNSNEPMNDDERAALEAIEMNPEFSKRFGELSLIELDWLSQV